MSWLRRHRWTLSFVVGLVVIVGGIYALHNETRDRISSVAQVGSQSRARLDREARAREASVRAAASAQTKRASAEALARDYTVCIQINEIRRSMRRLGFLLVARDGIIDSTDLKVLAIVDTQLADKPCPPAPKVAK